MANDFKLTLNKQTAFAFSGIFVVLIFRPLAMWLAVRGNSSLDEVATIAFLLVGTIGVAYSLMHSGFKVETISAAFFAAMTVVVVWNWVSNDELKKIDVEFFNYFYMLILHLCYLGIGYLFGALLLTEHKRQKKGEIVFLLFLCLSGLYLTLMDFRGFSAVIFDYRYSSSYHFIGLTYSILTMYVFDRCARRPIPKALVLVIAAVVLFFIGNNGAIASMTLALLLCRFNRWWILATLVAAATVYFLLPQFIFHLTGLQTILGRATFDAVGFQDIFEHGGVFAGQVIHFDSFGSYMHNFFSYFRQFGVFVWVLAVAVMIKSIRDARSRTDKMIVIFFVSQILLFRTFANALILFPTGYLFAVKVIERRAAWMKRCESESIMMATKT